MYWNSRLARPEDEVLEIMCTVTKDLMSRGADKLTLGCADMTKLKDTVQTAVRDDVQVIDGVLAGVQHLIGIVRMGDRIAR